MKRQLETQARSVFCLIQKLSLARCLFLHVISHPQLKEI
jgi:hypothetical protein